MGPVCVQGAPGSLFRIYSFRKAKSRLWFSSPSCPIVQPKLCLVYTNPSLIKSFVEKFPEQLNLDLFHDVVTVQ